MRFGPAPVPLARHVWEQAAELLEPALAHAGETDLADVEADLAARTAQLWLARSERVEMALVTQVHGDEVHLWLLGGRDMRLWLHFMRDLMAAARERGCRVMRLDGRRGWLRALKKFGWREAGSGLEVTL